VRLTAAALRHFGNDATPVLSDVEDLAGDTQQYARSELVHVVLENLPIPDDTASWDQILEFRSEQRLRRLHLRLRKWIIDRSHKSVDRLDTDIELKTLVQDYEEAMQAIGGAKTFAAVEVVVRAAGAVAGWVSGGLALGLMGLSVRKRQADLLDAELKAPGRELAFISKARERFGQ
jgi:hypothetical protein